MKRVWEKQTRPVGHHCLCLNPNSIITGLPCSTPQKYYECGWIFNPCTRDFTMISACVHYLQVLAVSSYPTFNKCDKQLLYFNPKTPVTGSRPRNSNFIRPSWDRRNLMLDGVIFRFTYPQPWKLSMCTAVSSDPGGFEQAGNSERKRLRWWRASLDLDAAGIRATACVTADQRRQCKASWATVKHIKSNQQKSSMLRRQHVLKKSDVLYHEDHCNAEMQTVNSRQWFRALDEVT